MGALPARGPAIPVVSTLIEWDENIPIFDELMLISQRADTEMKQTLRRSQNSSQKEKIPQEIPEKVLQTMLQETPLQVSPPVPSGVPIENPGDIGGTAPPALYELQRVMFDLVAEPRTVEAVVADNTYDDISPIAWVEGDARLSAVGRLDIYNSMYFNRILEAVGTTFRRCARWLGRRRFRHWFRGYIAKHPRPARLCVLWVKSFRCT